MDRRRRPPSLPRPAKSRHARTYLLGGLPGSERAAVRWWHRHWRGGAVGRPRAAPARGRSSPRAQTAGAGPRTPGRSPRNQPAANTAARRLLSSRGARPSLQPHSLLALLTPLQRPEASGGTALGWDAEGGPRRGAQQGPQAEGEEKGARAHMTLQLAKLKSENDRSVGKLSR